MSRPAIRNIHRRTKPGIPLRAFVRAILASDPPTDRTPEPDARAASLLYDRAAEWAIAKGWTPLAAR